MTLNLNDLFERAKAALIAGDPAAAAADARRVADRAPAAWAAHYLLAMAERDLGRPEPARAAFEAALALVPANPDVHYAYAGLLETIGERDAAIARFRQVVALRPDHVEAWRRLSLAENAAGSAPRARDAAKAAVAANPDRAEAWALLGWRHLADSDPAAAFDAFQTAVGLDPADAGAVRALAELEADRGGDALPLFARATALDPGNPDIALAHAVALHASGQPAAGLAQIEALAAAARDGAAAHNAFSKLAIAGGEPQRARDLFTRSLDARPRDPGLWLAYLQTLSRLGDHEAVLAAIADARAHLGDHPLLDAAAAAALDELGEHARAGGILQRLDEADGGEAFSEARVRHLLRTGQIEAAERRVARGLGRADAHWRWAYLATIWRMLDDQRSAWLEAPSFVQAVDLDDGAQIAAQAAPVLRALHTARAAPLGQSIQGGSQTDGHLFMRREPEIQRLAAALKRAVEAYAAALPPHDPSHPLLSGPRAPVRFSGSWSVRLAPGGLHVNHVHPDGWLSSAFYLDLPPAGPEGSTDGWLALGEPPQELGLDLAPFRMIEPRPGRLALFPSYTWHGTRPFRTGERLTAAFDVVAG